MFTPAMVDKNTNVISDTAKLVYHPYKEHEEKHDKIRFYKHPNSRFSSSTFQNEVENLRRSRSECFMFTPAMVDSYWFVISDTRTFVYHPYKEHEEKHRMAR